MAWQFAGTVSVDGREWSQSIVVFSPQLRLSYGSANPTVLRVGYVGWMRVYYQEQGLYSERWDKIWPKVDQEFVVMSPWEERLGRHAVQFRMGGRYIPVDSWSVTVEYWLESSNPGVGNFSISGDQFTVGGISIEF